MFEIIVKNELGDILSTESCDSNSCTIGRSSKNFISLKGWRIAGTHAQLSCKDDSIYLTDLSGGAGTRVNGEKITTFGPLSKEDVFVIGSYRLSVVGDRVKAKNVVPPVVEEKHDSCVEAPLNQDATEVKHHVGVAQPVQQNNETLVASHENKFVWHHRIHKRLMEVMDLRRVDIDSLNESELAEKVEGLINDIIEKMDFELPANIDRQTIATEVLNEAVALGPLEAFLADEKITEIMVNCYDEIYYESRGKLKRSAVTFSSNEAVLAVIDRIVSPLGRRIDESSPMVDGRLKDGSRINAIIPPLATRGPCLTIRKFSKKKLTSLDLVQFGAVSTDMMKFVEMAVLNRKNIIVSGGTGSGKTTFLNVLSNYIPHNERIITVEDSAELQLSQPHTVTLEARPANMEGKGVVSIRDLVKNCLRMRPDRIIVGECRGGETLDMLQAMNTGHDGSLTTVHANSPRDLISRVEVMTMMAGMDLPERAIREQVASAVHMVIQLSRFSDGTRKVTHISEITGLESGVIQMQNIFIYKQKGLDEDGMVIGDFEATGRVPEFYEDLRQRGLKVDMKIFG
ncbi:MAG: ATPase, T2SS/T4P/T4SS family [Desulforhopalus sp.]